MAPGDWQPLNQDNQLEPRPAYRQPVNHIHNRHFLIITQPKSWYSFYLLHFVTQPSTHRPRWFINPQMVTRGCIATTAIFLCTATLCHDMGHCKQQCNQIYDVAQMCDAINPQMPKKARWKNTDHFDFRCLVVRLAGHLVGSASKYDGDGWRTDFTEVGTQTMVRDAADRQRVNTGYITITATVVSHWATITGRPYIDRTLATTTLQHTENIPLFLFKNHIQTCLINSISSAN